MNETDQKLRELLKQAVPPVLHPEPRRDLWPQMLRRLEKTSIQVSGLDWALGALLVAGCALFPKAVVGLLYYL